MQPLTSPFEPPRIKDDEFLIKAIQVLNKTIFRDGKWVDDRISSSGGGGMHGRLEQNAILCWSPSLFPGVSKAPLVDAIFTYYSRPTS